MQRLKQVSVPVQNVILHSTHLDRDVLIDFYIPPLGSVSEQISLLLINDGQDLPKFHFSVCAAMNAGTKNWADLFSLIEFCQHLIKMKFRKILPIIN